MDSGMGGTIPVREAARKGLEYSQKAISLDLASSEGYTSFGHSLMLARRWNDGEVALRKAIRLGSQQYASRRLPRGSARSERPPRGERCSDARDRHANPVAVDLQRN
jgi:hypothetical protein